MSMRPASCILISKEGIKNGQGKRHPNVFKCKWQPKSHKGHRLSHESSRLVPWWSACVTGKTKKGRYHWETYLQERWDEVSEHWEQLRIETSRRDFSCVHCTRAFYFIWAADRTNSSFDESFPVQRLFLGWHQRTAPLNEVSNCCCSTESADGGVHRRQSRLLLTNHT